MYDGAPVNSVVRNLERASTGEAWTHPDGQTFADLPQAQQNTLLLTVGHVLPQILDIFLGEQVPSVGRFDNVRWWGRTAGERSGCLDIDPRAGLVDISNFCTATGPSRRAALATLFLSSRSVRIGLRGATRACNRVASRAPIKRSCGLLVDRNANCVGGKVGRRALVHFWGYMRVVFVPGTCRMRSGWRSISRMLNIIESGIRDRGRYWLRVRRCRVHIRGLLVLSRWGSWGWDRSKHRSGRERHGDRCPRSMSGPRMSDDMRTEVVGIRIELGRVVVDHPCMRWGVVDIAGRWARRVHERRGLRRIGHGTLLVTLRCGLYSTDRVHLGAARRRVRRCPLALWRFWRWLWEARCHTRCHMGFGNMGWVCVRVIVSHWVLKVEGPVDIRRPHWILVT